MDLLHSSLDISLRNEWHSRSSKVGLILKSEVHVRWNSSRRVTSTREHSHALTLGDVLNAASELTDITFC